MNNILVGQLRRQSNGSVDFKYDPEWLSQDDAVPVSLSLPLREDLYSGEAVNAVFDGLLPDSESIRRQVASRVGANGTDAFNLLSALGHDCVGALQFLPAHQISTAQEGLDGTPLTDDEVGALLAGLARQPLGVGADENFRISLAGVQEKTALLRQDDRWVRPVGLTPTTHILKPAIRNVPEIPFSVENEFLCLKLVDGLGLRVARASMETFLGLPTLVVERFDRLRRSDGTIQRLPQEDFCQALSVSPTRKYQSEGGPGPVAILRQLAASDHQHVDRTMFIQALVAFWLLGATDGHAKNFSVFLGARGGFRLTPLYDILSVQPAVDAGLLRRNRFTLAMAVGRTNHYRVNEIMPRHFMETAKLAGVGEDVSRPAMERLVSLSAQAIETVAASLPSTFPAAVLDPVLSALRDRSRLFESRL